MPAARHMPQRAANIQSRATMIISKLRTLSARHPDFARQLEHCIESITEEAARTPDTDRALVWSALEQGCNCVEDIMDETGLQKWEVRQILSSLLNEGLVEESTEQRHAMGRWKERLLYFPTSVPFISRSNETTARETIVHCPSSIVSGLSSDLRRIKR